MNAFDCFNRLNNASFIVAEFCQFRSSSNNSAEGGVSVSEKFGFDEVEKEIKQRTNTLPGMENGISDTPIIIEVHSPEVIDLTVVDLPGLVRVSPFVLLMIKK